MSYNVSLYSVIDRKRANDAIEGVSAAIDRNNENITWDMWENSVPGHAGIRSMRIRMFPQYAYPDKYWEMSAEEYQKLCADREVQYAQGLKDIEADMMPKIRSVMEANGVNGYRAFIARYPVPNLSVIVLYKSRSFRFPHWRAKIGDIVAAFPDEEYPTLKRPAEAIIGKIVNFIVSSTYNCRYEGDEEEYKSQHYVVECVEDHPYGYKIGDLFEANHVFQHKV